MVKYTLKIGKGKIEIECQDIKTAHKAGSVYGAIPEICSECKSDDLYLSHKSPKGNDYYTITCKKCGAELTLHQKKEGGFYVTRDDVFKKYVPQEGTSEKFEDDIPENIF